MGAPQKSASQTETHSLVDLQEDLVKAPQELVRGVSNKTLAPYPQRKRFSPSRLLLMVRRQK
jgi:hypothetical protein